MANNTFQFKRSTVAGKVPNTSTLSIGELALNLTDQKLYTSNGTGIIELSSNLTSLNVNNTINVGNSSVNAVINSTALTVKSIVANGGIGTAGQVLHSNGSATYWAADDQGVTSVATGNGMTGGTITTTGTVSVLANNGISANATGVYVVPGNGLVTANSTGVHVGAGNGLTVNTTAVAVLSNNGITANATGLFVTQGTGTVVNATGVHVNAAYINTISSNNASFLGGTAAASYQLNSTLNANIASYLPTYTGIVNGSSHTVGSSTIANSTGVYTTGTVNGATISVGTSVVANSTRLVIGTGVGLQANGGVGTAGQILTSNGTTVYWSTSTGGGNAASKSYSVTTVSGSQNTFSLATGFLSGTEDVYLNGVHLSNAEYSVVNSTAIQLSENATNGAIVELSGWYAVPTVVAGAVAGANTTIQFNDSSTINGVANFTFNKANNTLTVGNTTAAATLNVVGSYSLASANALSQTLTDGATINWNTASGQIATVTLGGNRTMAAPTNLKIGTYVLNVLQDAVGGRTLTWNAVFKWPAGVAPVLTTTASRRDIIFFYSDGTNLYGSFLPDVR